VLHDCTCGGLNGSRPQLRLRPVSKASSSNDLDSLHSQCRLRIVRNGWWSGHALPNCHACGQTELSGTRQAYCSGLRPPSCKPEGAATRSPGYDTRGMLALWFNGKTTCTQWATSVACAVVMKPCVAPECIRNTPPRIAHECAGGCRALPVRRGRRVAAAGASRQLLSA
jgi:hypothetical protein